MCSFMLFRCDKGEIHFQEQILFLRVNGHNGKLNL